MRSSWSLLRGLFRRPSRPTRPPPRVEPESAAPEPEIAELWADEVDEDDWGDDGAPPEDEPDPFVSGTSAPAEPAPLDLRAVRAYARMQALGGEHRIGLSSPAGPGSLAEALNRLLEEGLVEAQFVEDHEQGPHILYRPTL